MSIILPGEAWIVYGRYIKYRTGSPTVGFVCVEKFVFVIIDNWVKRFP